MLEITYRNTVRLGGRVGMSCFAAAPDENVRLPKPRGERTLLQIVVQSRILFDLEVKGRATESTSLVRLATL
jgi:hypothetical protein